MALPYHNPSLSERAEDDLRLGSVSDESQISQTKQRPTTKRIALRRALLTAMYVLLSCFITPSYHYDLTNF